MTVSKKIAAGVALALLIVTATGAISYRSVTVLIGAIQLRVHTLEVLKTLGQVDAAMVDAETTQRGYVIAGAEEYATSFQAALLELDRHVAAAARLTSDNASQQTRIAALRPKLAAKVEFMQKNVDTRRTAGMEAAAKGISLGEGRKLKLEVRAVLGEMTGEEERLLNLRDDAAHESTQQTKLAVLVGTGLAFLVLAGGGVWIARGVTGEVGSAVRQIETSSSELASTATHQTTAAKEQATSTTEVATTTKELLATSRQIAESGQHVSRIAGETDQAARAGGKAVSEASDALGRIRKQVDIVVSHMLDLGRKMQQVGGVLDILNELSEQTNILAINASIEAAGAGESGRRFGVVADEVRRLADRVGGSAKEIRALVDQVRAASNTTVMATEDGAKAVEAGARRFEEMTSAFGRIAEMVATTMDASKEIEISARQQTTAVEQVNLAISDVAAAARESETASRQTLEASRHLVVLARELARLVRSDAGGGAGGPAGADAAL